MRRLLPALLLVGVTLGFVTVPVGAEVNVPNASRVHLSFDFSDNSDPASASGGTFNIITDVMPEHGSGVVRMVAVAPADSGLANLVCRYQVISASQVECGFNFSVNGTWEIRTQYAANRETDVSATAVTNIYVTN